MKFGWLRLTATLIAAGCAVVVWQIAELSRAAAHASALMIGVMLGAGVVGVAGGGLTLAPRWFLQRLVNKAATLLFAVRSVEPWDNRRAGLLLIALGVLTYGFLITRLLSLPGDPGTSDEVAFLKSAQAVHASGGPVRLVADLYGGRFPEANRHPLYIALLSLRPTERFGRGLSVTLGLITLLGLTLLTARSRGLVVAVLFCVLLATNMAFCRFSTRIVCDVLMVLWGGVVFLLLTHRNSFETERPQGARVRSEEHGPAHVGIRDALLIGALLGMAYLTKGTGFLLLVGTIGGFALIWGLGLRRPSSEGNLPDDEPDRGEVFDSTAPRRLSFRRAMLTLLMLLSGWIAVASPLLVRNVRMYGTPLYNTNTWLLFVDTFEPPLALSQRLTVGETARAYWRSHTAIDMARREITGLAWETFILLRMLGPCPLDDSRAVVGLPLALLALLSLLAGPSREGVLLAMWTVLFMVVFAWYVPIAAGDRFLLPLLAPLLLVTADGLLRLAGLGANVDPSRLHRRISWMAIVWCGASVAISYTTSWPIDVQ